MPTSPEQAALVERLRRLLGRDPTLREVPMFGGRSFMVDERIVVAALASGDLLVRTDPERHDDLVVRPGAAPATMGSAGRSMGRGWLSVAAHAVTDDAQLTFWIGVGRDSRPTAGGRRRRGP